MLKEISEVFNVCNSISVSGATTYTSSSSNVKYKDSVGYQFNWSGLPVGTFYINGSLDYNPGLPQTGGLVNAGSWATITQQTIASGSTLPLVFNLNQLAMPWVQFQFTSTTSSGVISAYFCAKSLG